MHKQISIFLLKYCRELKVLCIYCQWISSFCLFCFSKGNEYKGSQKSENWMKRNSLEHCVLLQERTSHYGLMDLQTVTLQRYGHRLKSKSGNINCRIYWRVKGATQKTHTNTHTHMNTVDSIHLCHDVLFLLFLPVVVHVCSVWCLIDVIDACTNNMSLSRWLYMYSTYARVYTRVESFPGTACFAIFYLSAILGSHASITTTLPWLFWTFWLLSWHFNKFSCRVSFPLSFLLLLSQKCCKKC